MRRPITFAALSFAAGIAFCRIGGTAVSFAVLAVSAVITAGLLFYLMLRWKINTEKDINVNKNSGDKRNLLFDDEQIKRYALLFVVIFLLGYADCKIADAKESIFNEYEGKTISIAGTVKSVEIKDEEKCRLVVIARRNSIMHERVLVNVKGYDEDIFDVTGRKIEVRGALKRPESADNPGTFDYSNYLRANRIYMTMSAKSSSMSVCKDKLTGINCINNMIAGFKQRYEKILLLNFDEEAVGAMCGIMFGDDTYMDEDLQDSFRCNGIGHLLAASGLHVGFVYALLRVLMRKPRTLTGNMPIILMLVVYAALAGFSASVIRAVFMIVVHMAAQISHRRYDFISSICFCALVLLVLSPPELFASGFQLSFLAVLTIGVILKKVEGFTKVNEKRSLDEIEEEYAKPFWQRTVISIKSWGKREIIMLVAMQAGMLPLTLYCFHYVSPAVVFLNSIAIALAGLIIPLGILMIPLTLILTDGNIIPVFAEWLIRPVVEFVYSLLGEMTEMLVRLLIYLSHAVDDSVVSFQYVPSPPLGILLFYYACLFFFCSEMWGMLWRNIARRRVFCAFVLSAGVMCTGVWFAVDWQYIIADVVFVDVGQGDCAHIKAGRGNDIMIDSGGSEITDVGEDILIPYFLGRGVGSVDLAVITHLHQDHYGGLKTMTTGVEVKNLMIPLAYKSQASLVTEETGISEDRMIFVKAGDVVETGNAVLTVLAPALQSDEEYKRLLEEEDENAISLVIRVDYKNKSLLFTGDIGEELENELCTKFNNGEETVENSANNISNNTPDNGGQALDGNAQVYRQNLLDVDILKVAHHGSRFSSTEKFLSAATPEVSVIQVGTNFYGHPTPEAMERILSCGSKLYRNDEQGAVMVRLGKYPVVMTMK